MSGIKHINVIGYVGLLTILLLLGGVNTASAYCDANALGITGYGKSSPATVALQQCLIEAGYSIPAGATGYFGPQTRSAVKQFYAEKLTMPDWEGYSVGPIGRSTLVSSIQNQKFVPHPLNTNLKIGYKALKNAEELKKYLEVEYQRYGVSMGLEGTDGLAVPTVSAESLNDAGALSLQDESIAERSSETNVQISGIDEPDIVKTDGQSIFISRESRWYGRPMPTPIIMEEDIGIGAAPYYQPEPTVVVDALPVDDIEVINEKIEETGEMLLVKEEDILVIFSQPNVVAYDVSDPDNPSKLWEQEIDNQTNIVTSRLLENTLYLVTQTYLNREKPCPIIPLRWGNKTLSIPCDRILIPERIEPVSHLYSILKVDPTDGSVEAETSVAGNYGGVNVMMSPENLYLTSQAIAAEDEILVDTIITIGESLFPTHITTQAKTIRNYDISDAGKLSEISKIYESYLDTISADERLRIRNELTNRSVNELQKHQRDMYRSRVLRIDLDTLSVVASGSVPGYLLNQFSMDEYEGNLRVAVTVDGGWSGAESTNDVYVLNQALEIIGQVQDLGLTEQIYSTRFMGDTGYLVTFRQVDPFYVLDLSTPTAPKMVGQLKIPGFSSYLEYLGDDLVLGVGREGNGVKLSIFDVSNPAVPIEKSKYQLNDSWTEVQTNHHAFLRDDKHEVFFIPGNSGGYIFSYEDGELSLEKALSGYNVKRAIYINDYMYIISNDKIRVLDEDDWNEVNDIDL